MNFLSILDTIIAYFFPQEFAKIDFYQSKLYSKKHPSSFVMGLEIIYIILLFYQIYSFLFILWLSVINAWILAFECSSLIAVAINQCTCKYVLCWFIFGNNRRMLFLFLVLFTQSKIEMFQIHSWIDRNFYSVHKISLAPTVPHWLMNLVL